MSCQRKKFGMGDYLKFQIRIECYVLTIHIRIRKGTILDFQILKITKTFCNNQLLKSCYCSLSAEQSVTNY